MKTRLNIFSLCGAIVTVSGFLSLSTQAATYTLNLTGSLSSSVFSSFDSMTTHFDFWELALDGLNSSNAITVDVGDSVTLNVLLDAAFTVPASVDFTFLSARLSGPSFPSGTTETTGSFILRNGGVDILVAGPTSSSDMTGGLSDLFVLAPPANTAFTFDELTTTFTIDVLNSSAVLDAANLKYQLDSPIPEPSAFILLGVSALGLMKRRR